jgi:hypothetical protein
MPTIIDNSYFIGLINLPNTDPQLSEGLDIQQMIQTLEPKFMNALLGYEFANFLYSNLDGSDVVYTCTQTGKRIKAIFEGGEFVDKLGRKNYWEGFQKVGRSAIANYIYCNLVRHRQSNSTSAGEMAMGVENASIANPSHKIITAWSEMVEMNWIVDNYISYWQDNDANFKVATIPFTGTYMQAADRIAELNAGFYSFNSIGQMINLDYGDLQVYKTMPTLI